VRESVSCGIIRDMINHFIANFLAFSPLASGLSDLFIHKIECLSN
jgi:hypothetical protein